MINDSDVKKFTKTLMLLSLLLGVGIVVVNILLFVQSKSNKLEDVQPYLLPLPVNFSMEPINIVKDRAKYLKVSIEDFEKEHKRFSMSSTEGNKLQDNNEENTPTPTVQENENDNSTPDSSSMPPADGLPDEQ